MTNPHSHTFYDPDDEDTPGYLNDQLTSLKRGETVIAYMDAAGKLNVHQFSRKALKDFEIHQAALYDSMGPAADDVFDLVDEYAPSAAELLDVLSVHR